MTPEQSKTAARIVRDFTYHQGHPDDTDSYDKVRWACRDAANTINLLVPDGREKANALTKLEEAMMHATAGIARNR